MGNRDIPSYFRDEKIKLSPDHFADIWKSLDLASFSVHVHFRDIVSSYNTLTDTHNLNANLKQTAVIFSISRSISFCQIILDLYFHIKCPHNLFIRCSFNVFIFKMLNITILIIFGSETCSDEKTAEFYFLPSWAHVEFSIISVLNIFKVNDREWFSHKYILVWILSTFLISLKLFPCVF